MEYSYRNRSTEKETTIQLQQYDMVVMMNKTRRIIPYAEVTDIRLTKSRETYSLHISAFDCGNVLVKSHSFEQTGEKIDQAHAYLTFTRVLHMHLLEKSKPNYSSGFNVMSVLLFLGIWALVASLFFFIEEYFNFTVASPLLVSALIFSVGLSWQFGVQLKHWPMSYNPANIPLHLLPSGS